MNKVILMGRLTRDPEVRYSQGEKSIAIARYTLAVDRKFKKEGEQSADFISCVAMGKNGEFAEKYLKQGTKVAIEGRIQTGSYTNKDGQKVFTTDVMVDNVEFCGGKKENSGGGNYEPVGVPAQEIVNQAQSMGVPAEFEEILSDGELPF